MLAPGAPFWVAFQVFSVKLSQISDNKEWIQFTQTKPRSCDSPGSLPLTCFACLHTRLGRPRGEITPVTCKSHLGHSPLTLAATLCTPLASSATRPPGHRPGPGPKTALPEGPRLREPPLSTPRAPQPATVARSRHSPRTQTCRRGGGTGGTAGLQNPPASNFRSWGRDQLTSGPAGADGTVDFQTRGRGEARGSSLPGPPLSPREERTGGAIE